MIPIEFIYIFGLLNLVGTLSYALATARGRAKPNRVTWTLWYLASLIVYLVQTSEGVGAPSFLALSGAIGTGAVLIASFHNRKAYWRINSLDILCGTIALFALVLWVFTRQGLGALYLSILADFLASLPTVVKAYRAPETESWTAYLPASLAGFATLLTAESWNPEAYAFSLYVGLISGVIYILVKFPNFRPIKARVTHNPNVNHI